MAGGRSWRPEVPGRYPGRVSLGPPGVSVSVSAGPDLQRAAFASETEHVSHARVAAGF